MIIFIKMLFNSGLEIMKYLLFKMLFVKMTLHNEKRRIEMIM